MCVSAATRGLLAWVVLIAGLSPASAADHAVAESSLGARVAPASGEGLDAIRNFRIPKGWKVDLIAAEPDLANPVAFGFDENERIYVVETFRHSDGVLDIRGRTGWPSAGYKKDVTPERWAAMADELLDADLANRTVADRERMLRHYFAENASSLERFSERLKLIYRGSDGRALRSTVFADGFNSMVGGLASGVLARDGDVWFTDVPNLWRLRDRDGDGVSDERTVLSRGYGVRVGFLGHDLHGLRFGPDGLLYFTIGDRGANVTSQEGRPLVTPDTGAVFRCEPDGSNLEIFATGLRNPQELVFDALGNLWTGDNNSDGGDQARWTYLVEGGDSGWHIGWQFLETPNPRGPWNSEGMWRPADAAKIGHLVPPLANIGAGPSGITYDYGVGLPVDLAERFFMTDFRGGPSGIWSIAVEPKGAGYAVTEAKELLWNMLPTDVEVGPDGGLYWSDWVQGWNKPGKGRIYRAYDPEVVKQPIVAETRRLLGLDARALARAGRGSRAANTWAKQLAHPDMRVRQRAQFALADRGADSVLTTVVRTSGYRHARLHALWGLGQIARKKSAAIRPVLALLQDTDPEIRGQAAKVLGDLRHTDAARDLERMLGDGEPRPRFFAAIALGKLADPASGEPLIEMLKTSNDQDPFLRHAGIMGLVSTRTAPELAALANHGSVAVRRAAVVALRRQASAEVAVFLNDPDPDIVLEAARAANDLPIDGAVPALAALVSRDGLGAPVLRRALNANLRAGGPEHAQALATFAAKDNASLADRVEALRHLGRFAQPPGRDAVTGLWRPLAKREPQPALDALQEHFATLLKGPDPLIAAAVEAAGMLEARALTPKIQFLARDVRAGVQGRVAAIAVLGGWRDRGLAEVLADAVWDNDESVRSEAVRWQARLGIADVLVPIRFALEQGSVREKQQAITSLGAVRTPAAEALLVQWLDSAAARRAPAEIELELMEAALQHPVPAVNAALARFEQSLQSTNAVQTRRFVLNGGDAAAGRKVFWEKESVQCLRCHKAGGEGGVVGPDLARIGAEKPREYLLESILQPNAFVAQGFENVMIELRDGREYAGTVQSESDLELNLNTPENGVVTVKKFDIADRRRGLSAMPDGLADILSARELRDLVEFLAGLKGP